MRRGAVRRRENRPLTRLKRWLSGRRWGRVVRTNSRGMKPRAPADRASTDSSERRSSGPLTGAINDSTRQHRGNNLGNTGFHERPGVERNLQRLPAALERSAIDLTAVPDLYHIDNESIVFNRIDDPVRALPDPVAVEAGQLLATRWPGILGQLANPPHDSLPILFAGDRLDLFGSGSLDQDPKSCHAV